MLEVPRNNLAYTPFFALEILWWPLADAAMFQYVYWHQQSTFLVLFQRCILLEIKLNTTTTTTTITTITTITTTTTTTE